ncbi:MAG: fimbria major subunit [Muribaculaceae bacterium]|nr:fimbria major subunit [Muribaculaceae bacterium]
MNIFKYIIVLTISFLSFASCVDETLVDNSKSEWQQGDTAYYIKLNLKVQSSTFTDSNKTRIGLGVNNGTHDEHAISPKAGNFAIFFDEDDEYISCADLYSINETSLEGDVDEPQLESIYSCRFYGFADRKPAKVLVVVNSPKRIYDKVTDFPGWNLDQVRKLIWEEKGQLEIDKYREDGIASYIDDPYKRLGVFEDDDHTMYYTMTNAVYLERDEENSYTLHDAEPIPDEDDNKGKYITTDETQVENLKPIKVYLERMVSKVNLELSFEAKQYNPITAQPLDVCHYENGEFYYTEAPWGVEILGWGMNGLETQNYLFKNISIYRDEVEGEAVTRLADWITHEGWNSEYNKRCFWSEDPHYTKDTSKKVIYPWQFDFARDKYDSEHKDWYDYFQSYDNHIENQSFALTYYPFSKFCSYVDEDGNLSEDYQYDGDGKIEYIPENTFIPGMQVDRSRGTRSYELAASHVILCARLLLQNQVGDEITYSAPEYNIYRNRVGVSYIDEVSMLEDFMNAVNFKLSSSKYMYFKYYEWDESKTSDSKKTHLEDYLGYTMRAMVEGEFALYCYFPHITVTDNDPGVTMELNYQVLKMLDDDNTHYKLTREADAVNADGKVIPWIMYREDANHDWRPLDILILKKKPGDADKYDFVHINQDTKGEYFTGNPLVGGSRFAYVNGDSEYEGRKLEFQKNTGSGWEGYNPGERDDNDIQSLFFEIWGVADCFVNGLMYYAVPIYAQDITGLPASTDEKILDVPNSEFNDPSFYYYYGVIRNNWYKLNIHSIKDIGVPVSNPFKPIVPNYTNKRNQLKVEMQIIPMHMQEIVVTM